MGITRVFLEYFMSSCIWMLLMISDVQGRGCYQPPKIYIVHISEEKMLEKLFYAKLECETSVENASKDVLYCDGVFDTLMCWPSTSAGTVAEQPCPDYINKVDTRGKARRQCLEDGTWYVNPEINSTWTDYTECYSNTSDTENSKVLDHLQTIKVMYTVGYSLSFAVLVVAIVIMVYFRKLHCQRNTVHINLFISFALRSVICFIKDIFHTPIDGVTVVENDTPKLMTQGENWYCKLIYSLVHYIIIANYMWIFVEGLYLHTLIFVSTFKKSRLFYFFIIFGWGSPVLCVVPWAIVRLLLEDTACWSTHNPENKFDWILRGPIVVSICINFLFFMNIIRVLFIKLTATKEQNPHRYRKLARSTLVLIPLFGVYFMISVVLPDCMEDNLELVWLYVESGVNSIQGFVVALLFCFLNGEVRKEITKWWYRQRLRCKGKPGTHSNKNVSHSSMVPSVVLTETIKKDDHRQNGNIKANGKVIKITCGRDPGEDECLL